MNKKENITCWCVQADMYSHTAPVSDALRKALTRLMRRHHCDEWPAVPALSVQRMLPSLPNPHSQNTKCSPSLNSGRQGCHPKAEPRAECCPAHHGPEERHGQMAAGGTHSIGERSGAAKCPRRAEQVGAAGRHRFGIGVLALEERQQKTWGLGEQSHTISGRDSGCLRSNTSGIAARSNLVSSAG